MANVGGGGEVQYDQRLFNQEQGMTSGFGAGDDAYTAYDKPLFADRANANLFRPSKGAADDDGGGGAPAEAEPRTERFRPDKGFAVGGWVGGAGGRRLDGAGTGW